MIDKHKKEVVAKNTEKLLNIESKLTRIEQELTMAKAIENVTLATVMILKKKGLITDEEIKAVLSQQAGTPKAVQRENSVRSEGDVNSDAGNLGDSKTESELPVGESAGMSGEQ